jgi:hypothetical protein
LAGIVKLRAAVAQGGVPACAVPEPVPGWIAVEPAEALDVAVGAGVTLLVGLLAGDVTLLVGVLLQAAIKPAQLAEIIPASSTGGRLFKGLIGRTFRSCALFLVYGWRLRRIRRRSRHPGYDLSTQLRESSSAAHPGGQDHIVRAGQRHVPRNMRLKTPVTLRWAR